MFISTPDLFDPSMTTPTPKLYKSETRYLETHFGRKYYVLTSETIPLILKHLQAHIDKTLDLPLPLVEAAILKWKSTLNSVSLLV